MCPLHFMERFNTAIIVQIEVATDIFFDLVDGKLLSVLRHSSFKDFHHQQHNVFVIHHSALS